MGEDVQLETAQAHIEDALNAMRLYRARGALIEPTDAQKRVASRVITKLEEAELWLTKVRQ